jgi:hypothetical protein
VGGGVVLRRHLDEVAADDVDAREAAQDRLGLARGQAADLGRAGARREGRVERVDVEGEVDRPVADHRAGPGDDRRQPHGVDVLGVDTGHA